MDWGVAKMMPKAGRRSSDESMEGAIVGTPAYMSPEQASGQVEATDQRSDLYGATVLFHELLAVRHYLDHCRSLQELMTAIQSERFPYMKLVFLRNPGHPVPPAELLHFVAWGLAKDPARRYQTAEQMLVELQRIRDGRCRVSCPATLAKRMTDSVGLFVRSYPKLSPFVFYSVLLLLFCYVGVTARLLLTHT